MSGGSLPPPVCLGRDVLHCGAGFDSALRGNTHRRRDPQSPGRLRQRRRSAPRRRGNRLSRRPGRRNAIGLPVSHAAAWILVLRPSPHRGKPRWIPRPPDGLRALPPCRPEVHGAPSRGCSREADRPAGRQRWRARGTRAPTSPWLPSARSDCTASSAGRTRAVHAAKGNPTAAHAQGRRSHAGRPPEARRVYTTARAAQGPTSLPRSERHRSLIPVPLPQAWGTTSTHTAPRCPKNGGGRKTRPSIQAAASAATSQSATTIAPPARLGLSLA